MARQRLRGLVGSLPTRLDVRERLAKVYRLERDLVQAGRWSYLNADPDAQQVQAFERAYTDPFGRMKALGWRGPRRPRVRWPPTRLRALREEAEREAGGPVTWENPRPPEQRPTVWVMLGEVGCLVLDRGPAWPLAQSR